MAILPVSATIPTVVFVPSTSGTPHAVLYNNGPAPVYLGGSGVSTNVGFPLAVGDKLRLPYNGGTIWAISGYSQVQPQGTVITATTTAGGTTLTSAMGTAFTAGMWIAVETGTPRQEIAQVNGNNAGSVFTNGPLTYCHGTASTFWQITPTPTVVKNSHIGAT
jgi:hypothetical protein